MWKMYRVVLELLSPLHIGQRKIGNVIDTRHYLPGRAMWGALTSRITRNQGNGDYAGVGSQVQTQLAWTYFYPSTQTNKVSLWPWDDGREFEWLYLGSYASTALEDGHTADKGTLHEIEYIAPRTRCGHQVYLLGYFFEQDDSTLQWQGALSKLQLGGERSYGWGGVRLTEIAPSDESCFGAYGFLLDADRPIVEVRNGQALAAHTLATESEDYHGRVEPLVGRETDTRTAGFGAHPSPAIICWVPGTRTLSDRTFRIGHHGVWEPA